MLPEEERRRGKIWCDDDEGVSREDDQSEDKSRQGGGQPVGRRPAVFYRAREDEHPAPRSRKTGL